SEAFQFPLSLSNVLLSLINGLLFLAFGTTTRFRLGMLAFEIFDALRFFRREQRVDGILQLRRRGDVIFTGLQFRAQFHEQLEIGIRLERMRDRASRTGSDYGELHEAP